jgi:hypothetical protein
MRVISAKVTISIVLLAGSLEKAKKFGSCRWPLRLLADPADIFFSPSTPDTSLMVSARAGSIGRMDATLRAQLPFR